MAQEYMHAVQRDKNILITKSCVDSAFKLHLATWFKIASAYVNHTVLSAGYKPEPKSADIYGSLSISSTIGLPTCIFNLTAIKSIDFS